MSLNAKRSTSKNKASLRHIASALAFYGKYGLKAASTEFGISKQTLQRWEREHLNEPSQDFQFYYDEEVEKLQEYHRVQAARRIYERFHAQSDGHQKFQEMSLRLLEDFNQRCKDIKLHGENLSTSLTKDDLYYFKTISEIYERHALGENALAGLDKVVSADNAQRILEGLNYKVYEPQEGEPRRAVEDYLN